MSKQPARITSPTADGETPTEPDPDTDTVTLEFRGEKFDIPKRRGRWPIEAVLQFGRGNLLRAFNELLTADDWKRLKKVAVTLDDFDAFASPAVSKLSDECDL